MPSRSKASLVLAVLAASLVVVMIAAISLGTVSIPLAETLHILTGWQRSQGPDATILLAVRVPRVLTAVVVGAGLAVAGAVMQGLFRNPMAEPSILGVSSGSALGAVLAVYTGLAASWVGWTPVLSFAVGMTTVLTVYRLARVQGGTGTSTLLLAGVAMSSLMTAIVALVISLAPPGLLKSLLFWIMGGLNGSTWSSFWLVAVVFSAASLWIYSQWRELDLLLTGTEEARSLGVPVEWTRISLLVAASAVTGAAVAVSGVIGFVGLIVPHMVRRVTGPGHRLLLPASALVGAGFLVLADLVARTAMRPVELHVGIITSFIGVPFFLYLLRQSREELGM